MSALISSGLVADPQDYLPVARTLFVYPRKFQGPSGRYGSIALIPWRGVVTFEPVALRDFDSYVKRGGEIAGYISMVPNVYGYEYGWALTDNTGNLIWLAVDKRDCERHAISYLPSAAEQAAFHAENALATQFLEAAE